MKTKFQSKPPGRIVDLTPYVKIKVIYPKKDSWLKRFINKIICFGDEKKCSKCEENCNG